MTTLMKDYLEKALRGIDLNESTDMKNLRYTIEMELNNIDKFSKRGNQVAVKNSIRVIIDELIEFQKSVLGIM